MENKTEAATYNNAEEAINYINKLLETQTPTEIEIEERLQQMKTEDEQDSKNIQKKYKKFQQAIDQENIIKERTLKLCKESKQVRDELSNICSSFNSKKEESDALRQENSKIVKQKEMLESLYKDLEKQYKEIEDSQPDIIKASQEKRKELSEQFQQRVAEIKDTVDKQSKVRVEIQQEHETLKEQLSQLDKQKETRELLFEAEKKKKEIEQQLSETSINQQMAIIQQQTGNGEDTQKDIEKLTGENTEWDKKLEVYDQKNEAFNGVLAQSNEKFTVYKDQMETLKNSIASLEKQNQEQTQKIEKSNQRFLEQIQENIQIKKKRDQAKQQLDSLVSLKKHLEKQLAEKQSKKE